MTTFHSEVSFLKKVSPDKGEINLLGNINFINELTIAERKGNILRKIDVKITFVLSAQPFAKISNQPEFAHIAFEALSNWPVKLAAHSCGVISQDGFHQMA
jgi:hypothetical protein